MAEESVERKLCPKIQPTNNNMMDLPYNEKLNIVEKEVQSLYEFCLDKKFTNNEMYNCVSNLYGPKKSLPKKALSDSARPFFVLSGIVGLIAVLLLQPKIWSLAIVHAKLFSIKVILPYWDWSKLYSEECMITNYWLPEKSINVTAELCKYCEKFEVQHLGNVSHSFVTEMLANNEVQPFVVNDTTKDWNVQKLTMDEIIHIYQHHHALSSTLGSCTFQNNAGFKDMFYDFFNAYVDQKLPPHWHANWVNCDVKAAKVIRQYHSRPYFLPLMMQLESENIIITSLGMHPNETFTLPDQTALGGRTQGIWITVISGSLKFTLTPNEECMEKFGCKKVTVDVLSGETLFYVVENWRTYYTSADSGITIAVANSVVWDEM